MPDQPDFIENTDLTAAMSPEDLAELEARMQSIASRPAPTPESLERFNDLREGSQDRVKDLVDEAERTGSPIHFDLSTPRGHIDAVTFVRTTLVGIGVQVQEAIVAGDQVAVSELFSNAHDLWEPLTSALQFNVLLEFLMAVVGSAAEEVEES